jgi:hypothetical protein
MKPSVYLLVISILFFASCQKSQGPGGKAIINVHVMDGNKNVAGTEIKIKYGANTYPGANSSYDDVIIGDYAGKNKFEGLKRGDYYLYTSYTDPSGIFQEGGAYVKINNKFGEQHIVIDMGEEDPF